VPSAALLLYILFPLLALSASVLVMAPGFLVALWLDAGRGDFAVLLRAFAVAIIGQSVLLGLADAAAGAALTGPAFCGFLGLLGLAALVPVWLADRRGDIDWAMFRARRADILAMALLPLAVLLLLSAKVYWEALNGDGAHLFLSGQNLILTGSPFWDGAAGGVAAYPSITTLIEVIPNAWFQRLFGPFELSARLPVLPGLALLAGLVLDLIRYGRRKVPAGAAALGVGAALALFAWVLAWHASYDPYYADIALPLSREPFVLIAFLGFMRFSLDRNPGWTLVFAALSYASLPSAPVFMLLWVIALAMVRHPVGWRWLAAVFAMIVVVSVAGRALPGLLAELGVSSARDEFSAGNLAERLRFVTVFWPQRMLFWILPCGILPALAILAWRWQDSLARAVSLLTVGYAMFFYIQGYRVLPHHFAPVMVLPLIVYWRLAPVVAHPGRAALLALSGLAVAAALSMPGGFRPHLYGRDFGARIAISAPTGSYADDPSRLAAVTAVMGEAFPMLWGEGAWKSRYLGSPLSWYIHALQPKRPGQRIDYHIAPASVGPLPEGQTLIASVDGYVMTVTDPEIYAADVLRGGWQRTIGATYYVRRNAIFGSGGRGWPRPVIDLYDVASTFGLKGETQ
ncbi:MAG: hypothetical protein JNK88_04105, partial [Mangrovicoccus sp.]|nr:hypothetical protein [Mangrovicoccus sp.]